MNGSNRKKDSIVAHMLGKDATQEDAQPQAEIPARKERTMTFTTKPAEMNKKFII